MDHRQTILQLIGLNVRQQREKRGWSQDVLAELADLNRSYIGAVERAEHNIGINNLVRIAQALGVAITHLLDEPLTTNTTQPPAPPDPPQISPAEVVLHKRVFIQLLKVCADRPDLVLTYLQRCGVVVIDP